MIVFSGKQLVEYERDNSEYAKSFGQNCGEKSCFQKLDDKKLLEKIPDPWKKDLTLFLPSVGEEKPHDFLVVDGGILKEDPRKIWDKEGRLSTRLVIGTTAHAAYDPLKQGSFNPNMTAEEIRKYVSESLIGASNLTDQALKLYGESVQGLIAMISDIRIVCPLLVLANSQNHVPFYIATQTQGEMNVADVDSDIQAILGRYTSETPAKRRYLDALRNEFYYFVSHGKMQHYSFQHFVLVIDQDILPKSDYTNCNFWIKENFVPHYAA